MGARRAAGVLISVAVLALAGCDGGDLTGEGKLCELVPAEQVQELLDVELGSVTGTVGKGVPPSGDCTYGLDDPSAYVLMTVFSRSTDPTTPYERITHLFEDLDGQVLDFQRVEGLGEAAGFGPTEHWDGSNLNVVFMLPTGGPAELRIFSGEQLDRKPTLEQLRPIAEKILAGYAGGK